MKSLEIQVTYDFVCPWCWIGHHHLRTAIELAGLTVPVRLRYVPFELNPTLPKDGISRQEYRTRKFGSWARSLAMDADVALAGKRAGADFNFDRMTITSNSRLAHRLMRFAQSHGDGGQVESLHDVIFAAYFHDGRDIGAPEVLLDLAVSCGFDADAVGAYLESDEGEAEVIAAERQVQADGVHAVPNFQIGAQRISGAQPAALIAQALRAAAAREARV